ncbi:MAG: carboxypeptidase-like regulatory domain-containing protein [Nitrososphaeraceae archaeon]
MSQLIEISNRFKDLQEKYREYFPKVDPALINDLLLRQMENPSVTPLFMVEVFTKPGINTEQVRTIVRKKTGMNPAMYDNGTHCVITQKLTMEKLKEISELDEALEITGKYIGGLGGRETYPEQLHKKENEKSFRSRNDVQEIEGDSSKLKQSVATQMMERKNKRYKIAIFTAVGIVAAVALAGYIISGGLIPNINQNNASPSTQTASPTGVALPPGIIHGYVAGPTGLPAIAASVVAANQETGYTGNALISINGQYFLNNLPAGQYIVMVAYPDGTNQVVNDFQVESGSNHELNFSY